MRLASKIFLTSAVVVLVLAAVGLLSLRAVGRLASVNREITDHAVPAVQLASSLRDDMRNLSRLEARYVMFRDSRLRDRVVRGGHAVEADLAQLEGAMTSDRQRTALAQVTATFAEYRQVVAEERELMGRGERAPALRPVESEGASARLEPQWTRLRVDGALVSARPTPPRRRPSGKRAGLERRTWRGSSRGWVPRRRWPSRAAGSWPFG